MRAVSWVMLVLLAGCGAETVGTAATGAAIKQQEIQKGKQTLEQAQKEIGSAMQQVQQRSAADEEKK